MPAHSYGAAIRWDNGVDLEFSIAQISQIGALIFSKDTVETTCHPTGVGTFYKKKAYTSTTRRAEPFEVSFFYDTAEISHYELLKQAEASNKPVAGTLTHRGVQDTETVPGYFSNFTLGEQGPGSLLRARATFTPSGEPSLAGNLS